MLRVNVRCSYTLEVEEDEVRESDADYSSDEESQFDSHFTHLQLCEEDNFCNSSLRSADQALLTVHGGSFLDSENEDLGNCDNLLSWSGICTNDVLDRVDSDADSVSTEACSAGYADEDCAELDEMDHTHFDDDDERRFQLAALPFRSHLDLELDREEESTSFHHQSLEEDLPNVPTYRIAVGQNYGARSRIIRRSTSEYLQQQQRDSERGYVISPHLHLHDEDSPEASAHLKPLIPSLHSHLHEHEGEGEEEEEEENDEGECEGGQNVAGTPATPPMNDLRASSFGFPTPYEFACEVVQSMRDEANADRRQETPKEEESTPCYPRDTEPSSPFREKQGKLGKKKERVKFVWQPYESFSQYNFHTMYSMKKKKKSRADNPLPAVGSALTGLMHMYQNDKGMSKLPPCYFASKIAPVELIKKREIATSSSSSSSSSKGVVTGQVMELKKKEKGKCISQQQEEKQKKTKVTLRRERPSSPLQASIIPRKQSGRSTIMNAISHTSASSEDSVKAGKSRGGIVVTQRRNSRVQGGKAELMHQNQQTTSSSGGSNSSATLAKIDFKKSTSDQPSSSSSKARYDNSTNSYLHNSSLLNDSSALSGRKGVVRGLTFRRASEHSVNRNLYEINTGRELRIQPVERSRSRNRNRSSAMH